MWRSVRGRQGSVPGRRFAVALCAAAAAAAAAPAVAALPPAPEVAHEVAAAPPAPHVTPEAGLAISRSAAADRLISDFKARSDGGYDYFDPQGRFRARITADGRVSFRSAAPTHDHRVCSEHEKCGPANHVVEFIRGTSRWQRAPTTSEYGSVLQSPPASPATARPVSDPSPDDETSSPLLFGVGGRFVHSLLSDRVKAEFLRDTFDFRLGLARKAERRRLVAERSKLEDTLELIWRDGRLPLARRRELLFERWDTCVNLQPSSPSSAVDEFAAPLRELRHRAAIEARREVLRFIRERAPAGSSAAYTREEQRRLNARRRCRELFAPYNAL